MRTISLGAAVLDMDTHLINFSRKNARTAVFAVTLGNLLEWYEIYLYV